MGREVRDEPQERSIRGRGGRGREVQEESLLYRLEDDSRDERAWGERQPGESSTKRTVIHRDGVAALVL